MMRRPPRSSAWPVRAFSRWTAALLLAVLLVALPRPALAQSQSGPPSLLSRRFSELELERIRRALVRVRGKVALEPEGKRIESIEVVALPVFEPEDLVPQFLNWFHITTQSYVIEREVLLRIGQPYDQRLSDETERNLRGLFLFSVVVALPLEGSSPDSVRYLVVTKDTWSLRLGWNGQINDGVIDYLSLQPTERNLFGTGRQVFGTVVFGRRTYTLGLGYYEPRLGGSRTAILARADAIFNCATGELEGSSGSFQYSRPLYSTRTPWSYSTSVNWSNRRNPLRVFGNFGGAICSVRDADELRARARPDSDARIGLIPNEYLFDSQTFSQSFTRSYGYRYKTNLGFGLEAVRYSYGATSLSSIRIAEDSEIQGELSDAERQRLINIYHSLLARSDMRLSPFFQLTSFTTNFHRDINSETLALQEEGDFRLGHVASLRIFPAFEALGSTRDMLGVTATASYARSVDTGYIKLSVVHDVELSSPEQTDAALSLAFRFTSPRLLLGRFVYDARVYDHYRNYRGTRSFLGSTNRLRGFQNAAEEGFNYVVSNLEFRSRPLDVFSTQLGGVLFWDMGDAFDTYSDIGLRNGVGGGIRFLAPQLDRDVFRIDVGFPMPLDAARGKTTIIATFGQAFGVP